VIKILSFDLIILSQNLRGFVELDDEGPLFCPPPSPSPSPRAEKKRKKKEEKKSTTTSVSSSFLILSAKKINIFLIQQEFKLFLIFDKKNDFFYVEMLTFTRMSFYSE
jgi:hypothetical protein